MSGRRRLRTLLVASLVVFATFPHVYQLYLDRGPSFGPDEGRQVAGAISLAKGLGYTNSVLSHDLSNPQQRHLRGWPPGYSVTLWGLHSLGLDWVQAAFTFKILVLVIAIGGWFWMACHVVGSPLLAAGLMVLVPYRFIANPTDMACCALAPFFLIGLEKAASRPASQPALFSIAVLSLLACLIVLLKYSAIYLVGVGFFWLIGLWWFRGRQGVGLAHSLMYIFPPLLIFVSLMLWHQKESVRDTWWSRFGSFREDSYFWSHLDNPFEALFIDTFKLQPWLERLSVLFADFVPLSPETLFQVLAITLVVVALGVLFHHALVAETEENQKVRLRLLGLCCLTAGAFLVMLSVRYQVPAFSQMFRYYLPVAPLLLLIYVRVALGLLGSPCYPPKALGVMVLVMTLFGVAAYGPREYYRTLKSEPVPFREGVNFLTENIERISTGEPAIVVGSIQTFATADSLGVVHLKRTSFWQQAFTTQPVWLFVVKTPIAPPGR